MEFIELLEQKNIPFEIKGNRLIVYGLVDLSHMQIKEFPNYTMTFLGDVILCYTQLKELPNCIIRYFLNIQNTSITKIPKDLIASRIYTPINSRCPVYIKKDGKIGIDRDEKSIEGWEKFFKERKPFDGRPDLPPEDYNIIEQDFKTAVKLLESWNS